ncbi:hypothetical protein ABW20_dc0105709 [Dactylellina cionopaga]|nr:hypothetical protein ABW20_dc0105709 [Dactylellina cionopaga]
MSSPTFILRILLSFILFFTFTHCQPGNNEFSPEQLARNQEYIREQASLSQQQLRQGQEARSPPTEQRQELSNQLISSIIISPKQWRVFETALKIDDEGECPVYYLFLAGMETIKIMKQMDKIVSIMKQKEPKGSWVLNQKFLDLDKNLFRVLSQLYDLRKLGIEGLFPLIGPDGLFDGSTTFSQQTYDDILKELFMYEEVARDTVLVSGSTPVAFWDIILSIRKNVEIVVDRLPNVIFEELLKYPGARFGPTDTNRPYPAEAGKGRQDIGYAKWYEEKYTRPEKFEIAPLPGFSTQGKGKVTGHPWKKWESSKYLTADMYTTYLRLANMIGSGALPLMTEMALDIMLAANVFLGRRSIYPDDQFALPWDMYPKDIDLFTWLEQYPEWTNAEGAATKGKSFYTPSYTKFIKPPREGGRPWAEWDYWIDWMNDDEIAAIPTTSDQTHEEVPEIGSYTDSNEIQIAIFPGN